MMEDEFSEERVRVLKAMSGVQKLDAAMQLYWTARKIKTMGVRMQHPDWTEEQVQEEVRRIFFYARS